MILDHLGDLNWAAVAVSVVAAFAIGAVYFSPAVLGRRWAGIVAGYTGIPATEIEAGAAQPPALGKWLAAFAVNAVVLALAVEATGTDSLGDGLLLGLVLGLGIAVSLAAWPPIFARMPSSWWLLNSAAFLLMQAAMGAILGAWD